MSEEHPADQDPGRDAAKEESTWFVARMLLASVLVVLVFAHQVGGYGVLFDANMLLEELHGVDADPLEEPWEMGTKPPYCYRPLFRGAVLAAYELAPKTKDAFYGLFVTFSALSLLLAALVFEWLLRELSYSNKQALAGMALFLLSFPVLFSHDIPIHTREDFLGYAWIALTLVAVVRDQPYAVAGLGIVGAAIRETCLLGVVPFWFVSKRSTQHKLMAYAAPGLAWVAVRIVRGAGQPAYDYVSISTAPTREYPLEALLYLFACFGALWVAAGLRLISGQAPRHPILQPRVVLLALALTAATGWTMGMIREARITFILFPFVIPLALDTFCSERFQRMVRSPLAWGAAVTVLALELSLFIWLRGGELNVRIYQLRGWFNDSFNFGVVPLELFQRTDGTEGYVELTFASFYNGPHVYLNLAAAAFLLAGAWATTSAPRAAPGDP